MKVTTYDPAIRDAIEHLRATGDDRPILQLTAHYLQQAISTRPRATTKRTPYAKNRPPKVVPSLFDNFAQAVQDYVATNDPQALFDLVASMDAPAPAPTVNGKVRQRSAVARRVTAPRNYAQERAEMEALRATNQQVMNDRKRLVRERITATKWDEQTIDDLFSIAGAITRPAERREAIRALVAPAPTWADVDAHRRKFLRVIDTEWATNGKSWATAYAQQTITKRMKGTK